ncbi:DUF3386 domain-containing protein [Roseofilum sp. BLCC_M91]|uniref:DUF3386 domain-containing protein n=1 Tax=Roseofilum halophilum BLCC-M91 TaxID=3022259 RepID=A0ABT7BN94_9CYAN|nr:DUF3386 domain-containing protein [Roseofilum halophilum]MDJ1180641.1 DUF3386 domain-containing protein [Roseofilum halophilum BLCC-M91]
MTQTTNARDLFQSAYENRYTWDDKFPGISAEIDIEQGNEIYSGSIQINRDLTVEISGIENETVKKSVETQLKDVVTHRKRRTFEDTHGKNSFTLGETDDTGAVEIKVSGASMGSEYKLRDRVICYVQRVVGQMTFYIDTHETLDTGEGYLPTRYEAVFRNTESGEIMQHVHFEDRYQLIGNYFILTHQTLNTERPDEKVTTQFTYSNIKLLEPSLV